MGYYFEIIVDNKDGSKDILRFANIDDAENYAEKTFGRQLICFVYNDIYNAILNRITGDIPYERYIHIA